MGFHLGWPKVSLMVCQRESLKAYLTALHSAYQKASQMEWLTAFVKQYE